MPPNLPRTNVPFAPIPSVSWITLSRPATKSHWEVSILQVTVVPAVVEMAANDLATIGSTISQANAAALAPITGLLPAGTDEVSAGIAALFEAHGNAYQTLGAQTLALHEQFVKLMSSGAAQYAAAEAANASPLQTVEQAVLDLINSPAVALTGRPLIGNGADGAAGTGENGGDRKSVV